MENKRNNSLFMLAAALLIWFLLYYQTLFSMLEIWWRSETFAHGFLIFPISIYLIWLKRAYFFITEKKFSVFFTVCLLMLGTGWALARSVDVLVIQQLMVVLMLPAIIGSLFGFKLLKQYLFPLLYLLFAVPFGEFLIPQLQQVTAHMTVFGLELTGIPVYTEGLFISIPSGDFEVAVACSGIRYLIASLALGTLYAYLTYTKRYKQIIFVLAALIVPIIANGIRAYGILLIAHLSDMKYATGVDHLIYGWLFFGIVIIILFYVGSFWRDEPQKIMPLKPSLPQQGEIEKTGENASPSESEYQVQSKALIYIGMALLTGPLLIFWMNYHPELNIQSPDFPDLSASGWVQSSRVQQKVQLNWKPIFVGADSEVFTTYSKDGNDISMYIAYYGHEEENKELVAQSNSVYDPEITKRISKAVIRLPVGHEIIELEKYQLRQNNTDRTIMGWYYIFNKSMVNKIKIKITQAMGKLSGLSRDGYYIAYAYDHHGISENEAASKLKEFIALSWPTLKTHLNMGTDQHE